MLERYNELSISTVTLGQGLSGKDHYACLPFERTVDCNRQFDDLTEELFLNNYQDQDSFKQKSMTLMRKL